MKIILNEAENLTINIKDCDVGRIYAYMETEVQVLKCDMDTGLWGFMRIAANTITYSFTQQTLQDSVRAAKIYGHDVEYFENKKEFGKWLIEIT